MLEKAWNNRYNEKRVSVKRRFYAAFSVLSWRAGTWKYLTTRKIAYVYRTARTAGTKRKTAEVKVGIAGGSEKAPK